MTKMIFVSLPVADLARSMRLYEALGFTNEPRFTDATAAAMRWSDAILVMLNTREKWASFTDRPIADSGSNEVALVLSCDSRDAVDRVADVAETAGWAAGGAPEDHGFMMNRSLRDPDGHHWELMWMDPAVANGEAEVPRVAAEPA